VYTQVHFPAAKTVNCDLDIIFFSVTCDTCAVLTTIGLFVNRKESYGYIIVKFGSS